ncbi:hypothetical protein RSAG8_13375, partial [Rhizoctonia solani AG-8 WAC10335]
MSQTCSTDGADDEERSVLIRSEELTKTAFLAEGCGSNREGSIEGLVPSKVYPYRHTFLCSLLSRFMADVPGDTPTKPKHTQTAEYRSTRVTNARATMKNDIPVVPEVELIPLMNAVLHAVPPDQLNSVYNKLISEGHITDADENPRWECLLQNPSTMRGKETEAFKFIEEIVRIVSVACSKKSGLNCLVGGDSAPSSPRDNSSRPDGFLYSGTQKSRANKVEWCHITLPMEFKKMGGKGKQADDHEKVMWSMHHIMRNDPRRRFVHGMTCENTKTRLWYHDRCDVVASEEFDINKDWRHLVRIILSMLLAPPDRLGYDPNVTLLPSDNPNAEPNYDIDIRNSDTEVTTTYRTLKVISNAKADSMVGPGSRLWIVQELVDGDPVDPCYVLKDTWAHEDRVAEHVLLKEIREAQPAYAQCFLTPLDHGFAHLGVTAPDNTHKTLRRTELIPTNDVLAIHPSHVTNSTESPLNNRHSTGRPGDVANSQQEGYRDFHYLSEHPRQHYRIVFKEIGKPVHDLRNWTDVFTAIQGGWEGLHAMNLCGYVHRDVSSGNILLVPASGSFGQRGVIMDLEYAKKTDDTSAPHDVKTGTTAFMATEVAFMKHYRLRDVHKASSRSKHKSGLTPPPFRHNPLHDMESIWWLCVWMMFHLVPAGQKIAEQSDNYHKVFQDRHTKHAFITMSFNEMTAHLQEVPSFVSLLEEWFAALDDHCHSSYGKQDTSKTPMDMIRIDSNTIHWTVPKDHPATKR